MNRKKGKKMKRSHLKSAFPDDEEARILSQTSVKVLRTKKETRLSDKKALGKVCSKRKTNPMFAGGALPAQRPQTGSGDKNRRGGWDMEGEERGRVRLRRRGMG